MKRRARLCILLLLLLVLLLSATPVSALRGGAVPPAITVLVNNAPGDLKLTLHLEKKGEDIPVPLFFQRRGWETYYRFYREEVWEIRNWYGNDYDLNNAYILAESGGTVKRYSFPPDSLSTGMDDRFTLSWKRETLQGGLPAWRTPLLFAMRIGAGMLIEGVLYLIFGYRRLRSWLVFLIVNLVTLGLWSWIVRNWINAWEINEIWLFIAELACFLAEIVLFVSLVDEYERDRTVRYVVIANVLSVAAEIAMLSFLPV